MTHATSTAPVPTLRKVTPAADILEFDDRVELAIEVPGVPRDGIDLKFEDDALWVRATRQLAGDAWLHQEFDAAVMFERSFAIGKSYDAARIEATCQQGVLTITLPKSEANRARKIEIQ